MAGGAVETVKSDSPLLSGKRAMTWLTYLCLLMVGINSGWVGPLLPQISRVTGVSINRAGLIVSAASAGYFLSVLATGEIHQRFSARAILAGSMVLFTAGLSDLTLASGFAGLLVGGFLIGLANGGIDVGANALIVALNRERLAAALNYLHVLFGVGALLGPLIVSFAFAVRLSYWWVFGAGASLCAALALLLTLRPDGEVQVEATAAGDGFRAMLSRPIIWTIGGVMFLYVGAEVGIGAWLFLYLRTAGALSATLASAGVAVYWLGLVCGRVFGGRVGDRIAVPRFTMLASALSAAALLLLIVAPRANGVAALMVFLIGFGYGPVFPNMIAAGAARFPSEVGRMTSIVVAGGALGGIVVPWAMGYVIAMMSARSSMEVALTVTVAMAALAISIRRTE
jgi:fucose permease